MAASVHGGKAGVASLIPANSKGVDVPGVCTIEGVAEVKGNYPSKGGRGELAAWFRDSEGNLLGLGQPLP